MATRASFYITKNTTSIHLSRQKENYEFMSELSKILQLQAFYGEVLRTRIV